jgi:carbon-monoxide dehydrogenase medium subunit
VKPGRFTYHAPSSLDEALALLAEHGDAAKVIAGGQSLLPILNLRLAQVAHLVDVNRIPGFDDFATDGRTLTVPFLVRQRHAERHAPLPLLRDALRFVAHPQIRNRGTVCGSLAHADPAAELPAVMTALDAMFTIVSAGGVRRVDSAEFFQFYLTTCLQPDELLREVTVQLPPAGTVTAFQEFAARRGDFALAGVAVRVDTDERGEVVGARIAACGVGSTPMRLTGAERAVTGTRLEDGALDEAGEAARDDVAVAQAEQGPIDPAGDIHASAGYRRRLTGALTKRALTDARGSLSSLGSTRA